MTSEPSRPTLSFRLLIQVWLWRHGWAWPTVALLVAAALILHLSLRPQHLQALSSAQQALTSLRQTQAAGARTPQLKPMQSPDEISLVALSQVTISEPELSNTLRVIYKMARDRGISVEDSQFQVTTEGQAGLHRQQITLPLSASYPKTKAFLLDVLVQLPSVSLDQIQIKRDGVSQGQPETQIRFSVWIDPQKPPRVTTEKQAGGGS
jgi:hypothetical protein